MRFGVIARILDYEGFGVQTLLLGLLDGMLQHSGEHEIVLFVPSGMKAEAYSRFEDRCTIKVIGRSAKNGFTRFLWDHVSIPHACSKYGIDALFAPAHVSPLFGQTPAVVCVPDMMYHLFPRWWPIADRFYFTIVERFTTKRAPAVVAISDSTKADVIRVLGVPSDRVHVITPGIPEGFSPGPIRSDSEVLTRLGVTAPYIASIASSHPRKNLATLLAAWEKISSKVPHTLVLMGAAHPDFQPMLKTRPGSVRYLGHLRRPDMPAIFRGADAFVFPSLYEGFGLPVTEAMACGCPVITSDSSSLREVAANTGLLFDPTDSAAIAECIENVLQNGAVRAELKAKSLIAAQRYSFDASGKLLITLLSEAAATRSAKS